MYQEGLLQFDIPHQARVTCKAKFTQIGAAQDVLNEVRSFSDEFVVFMFGNDDNGLIAPGDALRTNTTTRFALRSVDNGRTNHAYC